MLEALLRYLARALAAILERYADPDLQKRLDAFNAKVAAADARAKEAEKQAALSEAAYAESVRNRKAWDKLIIESRQQEKASEERLRQSQERVKEIENETATLHKAIDARSDSSVLRDRL